MIMTKKMQPIITKALIASSTLAVSVFAAATTAFAELENPVLSGALTTDSQAAKSGTTFANYFANLWNAALAIGAIATLILFVWGAMEWIFSGGEKGHLESARNRILQAVIGLVILVGSYVILGFISQLLFGDSFDILRPKLPTALGG